MAHGVNPADGWSWTHILLFLSLATLTIQLTRGPGRISYLLLSWLQSSLQAALDVLPIVLSLLQGSNPADGWSWTYFLLMICFYHCSMASLADGWSWTYFLFVFIIAPVQLTGGPGHTYFLLMICFYHCSMASPLADGWSWTYFLFVFNRHCSSPADEWSWT